MSKPDEEEQEARIWATVERAVVALEGVAEAMANGARALSLISAALERLNADDPDRINF